MIRTPDSFLQPIIKYVDVDHLRWREMPDMNTPEWRAVSDCLTQYHRLRTAMLDAGAVLLLPGYLYPDWREIYGIPVLHVDCLAMPILGYKPGPWASDLEDLQRHPVAV